MFNEILKQLRKANKERQIDLAQYLGVAEATYARYESGTRQPDYDTLKKLADYFNVSIDYLFGNEENKKTTSITDVVKINVLGSVPAGIPLEAIEDIVDYEYIPADLVKNNDFFALKITGDSMSPKYLEGDTVIFKKQSDVESGKNAVVYVNGYDATFKKVIKKENGTIVLQPLNNDFEPIIIDGDETFSILGIPYEIRRKYE